MDDYAAIIATIQTGKRFLIASHYSPDGDGIGSTVALGLMLRRLGKEAVLYSRDPVPESLGFLPDAGRFVRRIGPDEVFDCAIMVDCAQRKRISEEFAAHKGFRSVACIDHHQYEEGEADVMLLDVEAASAGEVVLRLAKRLGIPTDAAIAQCIYTTLVIDTGFFKYSSTDARVLKLAAELVEAGASPWEVAKHLEESYPPSRMKLLAQSLATLAFDVEGRYATMEVTQAMLTSTGALMEYSDEFATYPRAIAGVEVAALFRETGDGIVKVSLRSKDLVDVAALARVMGGGGHARAAGVRIRGTMAEAKEKIRAAIETALKSVTRNL